MRTAIESDEPPPTKRSITAKPASKAEFVALSYASIQSAHNSVSHRRDLQIEELLRESYHLFDADEVMRLVANLDSTLKTYRSNKEGRTDLKHLMKENPIYPVCSWKGWYEYLPPSRVELTSSSLLGIHVSNSIDIVVEMPPKCFDSKDYLNCRALFKRHLYLLDIERAVRDRCQMTCSLEKTDPAFFTLNCVSELSKICMRIQISFPNDLYRFLRLDHDRSNLNLDGNENPTPNYNQSLLRLMLNNVCAKELAKLLQSDEDRKNVLRNALYLLMLWFHRRHLDQFTSLAGCFIAYLLKMNSVSSIMLPMQVFVKCLEFFVSEWSKIDLNLSDNEYDTGERCKALRAAGHDVVLIDFSSNMNVLHDISLDEVRRLACFASISLAHLTATDSFDRLFMQDFPSMILPDIVFRYRIPSVNLAAKISDFPQPSGGATHSIVECIKRALGDRAVFVTCDRVGNEADEFEVKILSNYSSSEIHQSLIKGPLSTDAAASLAFRQFWGDLSQLRRFRDGTINESVYFNAESVSAKHGLNLSIVKHILKLHYHESIVNNSPNIEKSLKCTDLPPLEEGSFDVVRTFNDFQRFLRSIESKLSLKLINTYGISPALRLSSAFAPIKPNFKTCHLNSLSQDRKLSYPRNDVGAIQPFIEPHDVLIMLEGSSAWPDDAAAFKRIKSALILEFVGVTEAAGYPCRLVSSDSTDVFFNEFLFRLSFTSAHEIAVLRRKRNKSGLTVFDDTRESRRVQDLVNVRAKVANRVKAVSQRFALYHPSVALVKRWLARHMLFCHFDELLIDSLMASVFTRNGNADYQMVTSPSLAFLHFLSLITQHDWKFSPFFVNYDDDVVDVDEAFGRFDSKQRAVWVVQPHDKESSLTSNSKPPASVFNYLLQLSSNTLAYVLSGESSDLFAPKLGMFDFVIHLNSRLNSKEYLRSDLSKTKLPKRVDKIDPTKMPVVGFDPIGSFYRYLCDTYSDHCLFFFDQFGGDVIGGVFKVAAKEMKSSITTQSMIGRTPTAEGELLLLSFNLDAFFHDIKVFGGSEFVISIDMK